MFRRKSFALFISLSIALLSNSDKLLSAELSRNDRFETVKSAVFDTPYKTLPTYKVNRKLFGKAGNKKSNKLLNAAKRTLNDKRDLLTFESGQKLLQANGICFAGAWNINENSPFTGLFSKHTDSPVIVRTSVSLSGTRQKDQRAIGMAIKFLPPDLAESPSLNAFVMHSMGGVVKKHTLDLALDNQPPLGRLPRWSDLSTALRLRKDFQRADREHGKGKPQINFRSVRHLAAYQSDNIIAPKWLRLSALTEQRIDLDDFRNELDVQHYEDNTLMYQIEVAADHGGKKSNAQWQIIGELRLNESVTSAACDQQLHFSHPSAD